MMEKPDNLDILEKFLSGKCTASERATVEQLLQSDPDFQKSFILFKEIWDSQHESPEIDVESNLSEVKSKAGIGNGLSDVRPLSPVPIPGDKTYMVIKYAAVVLLFLAIPFVYFLTVDTPASSALLTVTIEHKKQGSLVLSDGTKITLDAGSILQYRDSYAGDTRDVYLAGAGYFDVRSNPDKPFVVHTNSAAVTVLGTRFYVTLWENIQEVTVAVEEGRVSFMSAEFPDEHVLLSAGEVSYLKNSDKPEQPSKADIRKFGLWRHFEADYVDTEVKVIFDQLRRWYDLDFSVSDDAILSYPLTIRIQRDPVENIISSIADALAMHHKIEGNKVTFSPK